MRYAVLIERGPTSYAASVPDLPGCFTVGRTEAEVKERIVEAIEGHLAALEAAGQVVPPEPVTTVDYVEVKG